MTRLEYYARAAESAERQAAYWDERAESFEPTGVAWSDEMVVARLRDNASSNRRLAAEYREKIELYSE